MLRPLAASAAPHNPSLVEPEGAPGGATTAGKERKLKLQEARKVKRQLKQVADDVCRQKTQHSGC